MGKIRVKTLGIEESEKKQQRQAKIRQEKKSASRRTAKAPGLKGGERVVAVGPSEEEIAQEEQSAQTTPSLQKDAIKPEKAKTKKQAKKRTRSKRYDVAAKLVDKTKKYSLSEALALLPKLHIAKFDESIELHINTLEQGVSGIVSLPHGTGKKIRVVIADDKLIEDIIKEKINFDILLAEPSMMAKLAKVAKILGPRGLMPNPKNGTITANPEDAIKKFKAGQIRFKTETKAPIIHLTVGKISFGEKKLTDNITTILNAVQKQKIKNVTLKSTMSPGIKLDISTA